MNGKTIEFNFKGCQKSSGVNSGASHKKKVYVKLLSDRENENQDRVCDRVTIVGVTSDTCINSSMPRESDASLDVSRYE